MWKKKYKDTLKNERKNLFAKYKNANVYIYIYILYKKVGYSWKYLYHPPVRETNYTTKRSVVFAWMIVVVPNKSGVAVV